MSSDTDIAIQLFIQASIIMLQSYGFETVSYDQLQFRLERAGLQTIPFMPPESIRATPNLINVRKGSFEGPALIQYLNRSGAQKDIVKYYIRTGLRASQLICRNHLTGLDESNQYLEFVKREIGVASTFASGILALVNANGTLAKSFLIAVTGVNDGMEAFQEYRFLTIDRDAARVLVETAQNKLAEYAMNQIDLTYDPAALSEKKITLNSTSGGYAFSDAIAAVSTIENQCSREGIRYLLNRSINNTPSNMDIDTATGTIMFKSAQTQKEGTGPKATTTPSAQTLKTPSSGGSISNQSYESKLDKDTIKKWQAFCTLDATGTLADDDYALRRAVGAYINPGRKVGPITEIQGAFMNLAILRNASGCVRVAKIN